ncbi:MAG: LysR family transcriptional regulator, partial [Acidimicrobiales bacterium]
MTSFITMDLRQLHALLAVAEHQSFSAAARALHTVQSNVSTHVAHLENQLGSVLIERSRGELTPEGEIVAARARRILSELRSIEDDLVSLRDDVSGHVRLGVIGTTAVWLVPALLDALARDYPRVEITIIEATTTS